MECAGRAKRRRRFGLAPCVIDPKRCRAALATALQSAAEPQPMVRIKLGLFDMKAKSLASIGLAFLLLAGLVTHAPITSAASEASAIPAFPGAEGFGSTTPGGRGGKVIFVTNLNDSGSGSLRAACNAQGPRIVIFSDHARLADHCQESLSDHRGTDSPG